MARLEAHRSSPSLKSRLDALLRTRDPVAQRDADPVGLVHRYEDAADREVAGLVAALLAFGNVTAIRRSVGRALDALGPSPAATVDRAGRRLLRSRLRGFVHRVYRGDDLAALLAHAGRVRHGRGGLGLAFAEHLEASGDFREALARLSDSLRGSDPSRGLAHLVADPRAGSACKRSLLYLRWMVRPSDGVDFGLWPVSPSMLVIPVDTHIHRIGRNLGLTRRTTASWKTAEEITAALRRLDPADPVKYDFALCHLGVSRECPSQRDPVRCERCVLRPVCLAYRNRGAPEPAHR